MKNLKELMEQFDLFGEEDDETPRGMNGVVPPKEGGTDDALTTGMDDSTNMSDEIDMDDESDCECQCPCCQKARADDNLDDEEDEEHEHLDDEGGEDNFRADGRADMDGDNSNLFSKNGKDDEFSFGL